MYIDVGSSLNLACNVKQIDCVYPCDPYDPQFIIWMKNNKVSVFMCPRKNEILTPVAMLSCKYMILLKIVRPLITMLMMGRRIIGTR